MTYREAGRTAIAVQDAVNLSGVAHSFADAVSAIWDEAHWQGHGTEWANTHPVVTLFLDKLADLNRNWLQCPQIGQAYDEAREIADGNPAAERL
jgi:hypothetical protein